MGLRVLFLADTHLGFDAPRRPRVQRRRRGPDFFRCFERALAPALEGRADCVVHGGDLLYRARVPPVLVQEAMAPLMRVADAGVPVFLVPGNHERSRIPYPLLALHPGIHIFHRPDTFRVTLNGLRVALSGFPFARRVAGDAFRELLDATGWRRREADLRLLCMHQAVEGARVGVHDFKFRRGKDVIARRDIPGEFAAVLSGHIHRAQILTRRLAAPVFYPGSIERTSFAEREEDKGYLLLDFDAGGLEHWEFVPLPARPMLVLEHEPGKSLRRRLAALPADAVVRVLGLDCSAARLRAIAPPTMNVDVARRS